MSKIVVKGKDVVKAAKSTVILWNAEDRETILICPVDSEAADLLATKRSMQPGTVQNEIEHLRAFLGTDNPPEDLYVLVTGDFSQMKLVKFSFEEFGLIREQAEINYFGQVWDDILDAGAFVFVETAQDLEKHDL